MSIIVNNDDLFSKHRSCIHEDLNENPLILRKNVRFLIFLPEVQNFIKNLFFLMNSHRLHKY